MNHQQERWKQRGTHTQKDRNEELKKPGKARKNKEK
jgi:hypothetical protein